MYPRPFYTGIPPMRVFKMYIFDIETDSVNISEVSQIHTLAIMDTKTGEIQSFNRNNVIKGVSQINGEDVCGHNIIGYDIPVIKKFFPWFEVNQVLDTLVTVRMIYFNITDIDHKLYRGNKLSKENIGSHSLGAWGERLGVLKGDYGQEDGAWETWTPEMEEYCIQDVRTTKALLDKIQSLNYSQEAIDLENQVARILQRQKEYGFYFDTEKAFEVYNDLLTKIETIRDKLQKAFPPKDKVVGYYSRDNKKKGIKAGDPKTHTEIFNPGSRKMIAERLSEKYNWKPQKLTETGQPKVDEQVLKKLKYPEAELLNEYLMIKKLLGMIGEGNNAWLKMVNPDTNRIHGSVWATGAITGRMAHHKPNLAQIPRRSKIGGMLRELFTVPPGKKLVGCDASGLELRCLAHYLGAWDKGEYTEQILWGDIHTYNQEAAGLPDRDQAKTFIYALVYGASDRLLGTIALGKSGSKLRKDFYGKIPALQKLTDTVKAKSKHRPIQALDGRLLKVRSEHSALNTLLQGAGAIVMKKGLVILDQDLQDAGYKPGIDYEFVANVHDEWQIETKKEIAERVGKLAVDSIWKAGESFNMRCPLEGEYKVGATWAETH